MAAEGYDVKVADHPRDIVRPPREVHSSGQRPGVDESLERRSLLAVPDDGEVSPGNGRHGLDEHVEAKRPAVEADARVSHSGCRHAGVAKEARCEIFGEQRSILARIVEHDLGEAEEFLARNELIKFDREARFVVQWPKTAPAF